MIYLAVCEVLFAVEETIAAMASKAARRMTNVANVFLDRSRHVWRQTALQLPTCTGRQRGSRQHHLSIGSCGGFGWTCRRWRRVARGFLMRVNMMYAFRVSHCNQIHPLSLFQFYRMSGAAMRAKCMSRKGPPLVRAASCSESRLHRKEHAQRGLVKMHGM